MKFNRLSKLAMLTTLGMLGGLLMGHAEPANSMNEKLIIDQKFGEGRATRAATLVAKDEQALTTASSADSRGRSAQASIRTPRERKAWALRNKANKWGPVGAWMGLLSLVGYAGSVLIGIALSSFTIGFVGVLVSGLVSLIGAALCGVAEGWLTRAEHLLDTVYGPHRRPEGWDYPDNEE